jgi:autotransporter-associated beta strand protein
MKPRFNNRILKALLSVAVLSQTLTLSYAGQIWDGGGADNNWNTAANWDGDTLPNFASAITFAGPTRLTPSNNLAANTPIGGINFTNTATNAFTLSGNAITLGGNIVTTAATAALTDTISLAMALNAARTITTNTNHHLTISGVISGANNLTKNGAGILTLTGNNTFTGTLDVAAGTVRVSSANGAGANASIFSNSTSTNTVFAATTASALTFSKSFSLNTGGGAISFGDATGTGDLTFTGNLARAAGATNRTVNVAGSTTVTFNGNLLTPGASSATAFTKGGTGTLAIRGTGDATDPGFSQIVVTNGALAVTRLADLGFPSSLGRAVNANPSAASVTLDGGELRYISGGAAASSTDRIVQIGRTTAGGTGTISNNATSPAETVTFSNPAPIAYGSFDQTRTLVLRGTNTGSNTFAPTIENNGIAAVSLNKLDAGTWFLGGSNTYTGATTISGGTLGLSGTGSVNNSSGIIVNGSGATLLQNSTVAATTPVTLTQGTVTGSGTLNTVNVGAGTGGIVTNNNGVAGAALTIGALNFSGAASVNTFHAPGSFATALIASSITTNAAGNVSLNPSAPFWTNGTYSLMTYSGAIGGAGAGQIVLGTVSGLNARQVPLFSNTGSAFTLTISGDTVKWTGADDGRWQVGSTGTNENWQLILGGTPASFLNNDDLLFDDTATGSTALNITAADVSTFATTFNNSAKNYTLGSTGGFGITSGRLTKTGSGTLTLTNSNSYTGTTVISGGVLDVSTDGAQLYRSATAINSSVTVTNGGVLVVKQYGQGSTSGPGSPSLGNLANSGGQVIIDGGTLRFNNETGSRGRVTNIGPNGATFEVVNNSNYTWTTSPGTSVPFTGSGQTLTLTGDSTSAGGINLVIAGTGVSIVKSGGSTWRLAGANTYTGGTTINADGGTLVANVTTTQNGLGTGAVSVGSNSTLLLNNTATSGTIPVPVNNTFTGTGLIQLQFAANTTARNTQIPNLADFTGALRVSSLGTTGDKWNTGGAGTLAASLLVDSGNTLFIPSGATSFTGGITLSGTGNSEGRGAIRMGAGTLGGNIVLTGNTTFSMENATTASITGSITSGVAAPLTLTLGGTGSLGGTLGGVIGGGLDSISLATAVGGTYTLANANTYTGTTTIAAGTTLRLGSGIEGFDGTINGTSEVINNGTLTFSPFGSLASAYPISGSGGIVKTGPGAQSIGGINTFAGATTVNAGTLTLDYSSQDTSKLSDTAVLTLAGGTLNLAGGTHTELVASTTLAAGTASTVARTGGSAVLQMGNITPIGSATLNFAQSGIATTDTLNNAEGYLGAWATVNGEDLAVNSTNAPGGLITAVSYSDVTRRSSGTKVIASNPNSFVRIIEGTGVAGAITLGAPTTSIATLSQSAEGGSSQALVNLAGQTLAASAIFSAPNAGSLTIGNIPGDGALRTLNPVTDLTVRNDSATNLIINSSIIDNGESGLIKLGDGQLVLNGNNTYNWSTLLQAGTLALGSSAALGTGTFVIAGGALDSAVPNLVNTNNNPQQWNANVTFLGTNNLNLGTGVVTTNAARTITVAANTLTVGGDITTASAAGSHLTKLGNGTLALNGVVNLGNNGIIVNGGTIRSGGNLTTNTGAGAAGNTFRVGNLTNASAAWVQTGGSITLSVNDVDGMNLGNADTAPNAFGSLTLAGGTFSAPRINIGGSGLITGTNGVGIMNLLEGSTAAFSAYFIGGRGVSNTGSATIAGGTLDLTNTALVNGRIGAWGGGRLEVNIGASLGGLNSGGLVNTGNNPYSAVASNSISQGIANLLGGTLLTSAMNSPAGTSTGIGVNQFNFNGGALKYSGTAANANFFPAIPAGAAGASGAFVRSGGMILDNSGQSLTIAAALLAPADGEITSISVTGADAPGTFFTAPYVRISGGNNDATAVAAIKPDGSLDSIIITNPGSGYSLNPPTVTLVGGTHAGGSETVTGSATAVVGASTSGGFTKIGAGYITFNGNNTYTGVTTIQGGAITLNSPIPNPNTSYDVKAGAQAYAGWAILGATFPNDFKLAGSGFSEGGINVGALRSSNNQTFTGTITLAADARIGMIETTASCTFSGKITGGFALDIQGAHNGNSGTQTITFANTGTPSDYSGNTSLSTVGYGGARTGASTILRLGADEQIPHGSGKGDLLLNGPNANNLTILELDGYDETINGLSNVNAAGAVIRNTGPEDSILTVGGINANGNFSGVISDSGSGRSLALVKVGTGTLTLRGANTYIGTTSVNAGTLELVGGSQTSPITVGTGASLGFTLGSPTTSTSTFNLSAGTIKITGTPTGPTYTLITSSAGITGTPVLDAPIAGYELKVNGNSLNLVKSGYSSWAALNGAGTNLNDDHDGDRVPNGVEYFLGGPNGYTTGFTALPGVTNAAGTLSITWVMGAGYVGVYNNDFTVETSDTLTGTWTTESSPGTVTISGSNVTYTFPAPLGTKKFVRLKVTGP